MGRARLRRCGGSKLPESVSRRAAGLRVAAGLMLAVGLAACSSEGQPGPDRTEVTASPSAATSAAETSTPPTASPTPTRAPYDVGVALAAVRHLAGVIGPRHGTSPAFERAAAWVETRFEATGLEVRRQAFDVPGGVSWGVAVGPGPGQNVIATPPGFDPTRPHLVVGAHLDTVPQAPGAEDNASGVGVLLALAASDVATRLPVVWIAFGAEEPRGPGDDDHHFGSRAHVAALKLAERRAIRGMLSLDRVGVGSVVPIGSATDQPPTALIRAARRAGVPVAPETGQRSSDHWSFVRAGLPGLRVGSTPYAGYHNERDVPSVVNRAQLQRVGALVTAWLS